LGYLHDRKVAHRDLKLENLLYQGTGPDSPLKLVDFGLAWAWDSEAPMMQRCCGSPEYVAPEILLQQGYTSQCDLWSLGVVTFMLLVGFAPFPPSKGQLQQIRAGKIYWGEGREEYAARWAKVSPEAVDFVKRLLTVDPNERLSAQQAIFHPWLLRTLGNPVQIPTLDAKVLRSLQLYAGAPRVRRACLQLLAQRQPIEETSGLAVAFLGLDLGNEGVIRVRDLRSALCGQRAAPSALDALLDAIDALVEGTGVHYSEFLAACMAQAISQEGARAVFAGLDWAGKGFIDAGDVEEALGPVVLEGVPGGAAELLREADLTGEFAATGTIGFQGFLRILAGPTSAPMETMVRRSSWALFAAAKAVLLGVPVEAAG